MTALVSLILIVSLCIFEATIAEEEQSAFAVSGYLPDYRSYNGIKRSSSILTDLILFSIQPDELISVMSDKVCCLREEHYKKARDAKSEMNPSMDLLVSVGGGGRSDAFRYITETRERRLEFIQDLKLLW